MKRVSREGARVWREGQGVQRWCEGVAALYLLPLIDRSHRPHLHYSDDDIGGSYVIVVALVAMQDTLLPIVGTQSYADC